MKRIFDIVVALLLLIITLPLMLVAAMLVRFESKGRAVFVQDRLGKHEKLFRCYKIRTMEMGTINAASHIVGDSPITRIGHILRATKIDELPQLWNVICGDMSFVGPRPGLPQQTELRKARAELGVFDVRPGITGLGQINNIDMSTPYKLAQKDREYIDNQSMMLDLKILVLTAIGKGQGDAAKS